MLVQAVVRGRRLRRKLSQARQAATYTDDSLRHDARESDLDMDQMDDFLASLPDDDPSPMQSQASTSSPMAAPAVVPTPVLSPSCPATSRFSDQTLAPASALAHSPAVAPPLGQAIHLRQGSHALASTSGRQESTSSLPYAADLPALHAQSSLVPGANGSGASSANDAVSQSPGQRKRSGQSAHADDVARQQPGLQKAGLSRQGSHLHQQQAAFLPPLAGAHTTAVVQRAPLHASSISAPVSATDRTHTSSHFSLPPIHESPVGASTSLVAPSSVPIGIAAAAAAAAMARGEGEEDLQERQAARSSNERSARVSRASSSVRSEQSVGSQSPEKAAAKAQRHKVCSACLSRCRMVSEGTTLCTLPSASAASTSDQMPTTGALYESA